MILQHAVYRLIAELACIAGVISAAVLAYADKSAWVWSWFLLFGFANVITGNVKSSGSETTTETTAGCTSTRKLWQEVGSETAGGRK